MRVRHCWVGLSSSSLITQLPLLLQRNVNLMITINCCQLLHVYNSLCSRSDRTKLEFGSELKPRLGFTQQFGRVMRPQARRFDLVSNGGEEETAGPSSLLVSLSWDVEANTALRWRLLRPEVLKSGSLSHMCDQAVNVESAPASWKGWVEGCVERGLHRVFCFRLLRLSININQRKNLPPEAPMPKVASEGQEAGVMGRG